MADVLKGRPAERIKNRFYGTIKKRLTEDEKAELRKSQHIYFQSLRVQEEPGLPGKEDERSESIVVTDEEVDFVKQQSISKLDRRISEVKDLIMRTQDQIQLLKQ